MPQERQKKMTNRIETVVAIDPGKEGGIALIGKEVTKAWPMPMAGNVPNTNEISKILREYEPDLIIIESVHSMPGQGVASSFTFGRGFGRLETIPEVLGIPTELITPQRWKNSVLAGTAKDKAAAVEFCQRRHPSVDLILPRCRKPHDGMADALCMAEAGLRLFGGK